MKRINWQDIGLIILLAASVFGQLVRVLVFSKIALTASDIALILVALPMMAFITYRRMWLKAIKYVFRDQIWRYLALFTVWALISLIFNASQYAGSEIFASFSYWARLALIVCVTVGMSYLLDQRQDRRVVSYFILFSTTALVIGFVQLYFLPDLIGLASEGWDPHIGRLVSSFLDPNFFAAYLVILMTISLGTALNRSMKRPYKWLLWLVFVLAWIGLYLTYSRSGWLVGFIAVSLVAWPKSWRLSVLIAAIFIAVVFLPGRLGDRIQQSTSFINTSTVTATSGDASAAARAESSKQAWDLAKTNLLTGVGYNTYGYAMVKHGIFQSSQLQVRSSMGTDNSFLYVLATTGIVGLLLFLAFYFRMMVEFFKHRTRPEAWQLFCVGLAFAVGAFFNNIFFYMPIIITWWTLIAWAARTDNDFS